MTLDHTPASKHFFLRSFGLVIAYSGGFYLLQFFLQYIGMVPTLPTAENIMAWDGNWYQNVAVNGYQYTAHAGSNSAFYMLMPMLWRLLHLSGFGTVVLSALAFATGFALLTGMMRVPLHRQLLWLSVPTTYFLFIPYTEALFFLLAVLAMTGILQRRHWLIWVALFLAALTRATTLVILPALLIMQLLSDAPRNWYRNVWYWLKHFALPSLAGLAFFVWYQHWQTGVWFAYFKQQTNLWDRGFKWPILPFHTTEGDRTIWLSAIAMIIAAVATMFILYHAVRWLRGVPPLKDKMLLLAAASILMTWPTIVFFNPTWGTLTTNQIGLFRYTMATPFFFIVLQHFTEREAYRLKHYVGVFILANLVFLTFGSYMHIRYTLFFNVDVLAIFLFMTIAGRRNIPAEMVLFGLGLLLQVHLFQQFIGWQFPD